MATVSRPLGFLVVTLCILTEVRVSLGLECMSCRNSPSVKDCRQTTVKCAEDEECYLEKSTTSQLSLSYSAGCRNKRVCNIMAALGSLRAGRSSFLDRKRDLLNCAYCCGTEMDENGPCNIMADEMRNSNAVMESAIPKTVSENSVGQKEEVEQFPLHRTNKNFNVSLSSEYLFRELTSLVPVPLDSDDEESSPFTESLVHTCAIVHKDEESLLSAAKGQGNKSKLNQFLGNIFSKKKNARSFMKEKTGDQKFTANPDCSDFKCDEEYITDKDFLVDKMGKKSTPKHRCKLILSCFRKQ